MENIKKIFILINNNIICIFKIFIITENNSIIFSNIDDPLKANFFPEIV